MMITLHQLPVANQAISLTDCCPIFNPDIWDGKVFRLDHKLFARVTTVGFLHVPFNMHAVMQRTLQQVEASRAGEGRWPVVLSHEISPWRAEHYVAITKPVQNLDTARISGTFLAKVFEGPFHDAGMWYRQLLEYAGARSAKVGKVYFYYTTCPRCAKAYGKNYVVGLAEIEASAIPQF